MDTREATYKGVINRMASAILALGIGSMCFMFLGYNLWAYVLYLILFVPISLLLKN